MSDRLETAAPSLDGVDEPVTLLVEAGDNQQRLDRFVADRLPELSRSTVQHLIADGRIRVNGVSRRPSHKVAAGDAIVVEVPPPEPTDIVPEPSPLDILYEDADMLVLNKPAGLVVHPAPGHSHGTLVNALVAHAPEIAVAGSSRPGLVHRLDKDTSGVMVVAKTDRGQRALLNQWAAGNVRKTYSALATGVVEPNAGTIEAPIGRDPRQRQRMAVIPNGRPAVSHFTVHERFDTATFLEVQIETGRTHQIRVHLAFIGHPVAGDPVYGGGKWRPAPELPPPARQMLHATRLGFRLPDGQAVEFVAPLPADFEEMLKLLRGE